MNRQKEREKLLQDRFRDLTLDRQKLDEDISLLESEIRGKAQPVSEEEEEGDYETELPHEAQEEEQVEAE